MTRTRYKIYETEYPYFMTCTVVGWLPLFTHPDRFRIIYDSWAWFHDRQRLRVLAYVILENHLHFVASGPELSKDVGIFKSYTARQIIDALQRRGTKTLLHQLKREKAAHKTDREYQVWQEGSHPQQISSDEMMWQKIEYIHNNPVSRGYVDDPLYWTHSSATNYTGQSGPFPVFTDWR